VGVTVQATDRAGNVTSRQFTIAVGEPNTAPVLTEASPVLGSTHRNVPFTIGLTGTFINNGSGTTGIEDTDTGAVVGGIAVTGLTGHGTWQYSLAGSSTYQAIAPVSASSALLLPATAKLRYVPDGQNAESATITYRAWDTTTGANGGRADLSATSATGDTTAFSTDTDTASLTVTNVSDTVVLTPASPDLGSTSNTTPKTINLTGTFINNGSNATTITGSNSGGAVGGIAVTGITGGGTWAYTTDGTTYQNITSASMASALLLNKNASLRYTPDSQNSEKPTVTYLAWDTTSGSNGGRADLSAASATGGTTAYSTNSDTATLAVNTAPELTVAHPTLEGTNENTTKTINVRDFINNGSGTTTISDANDNDALGGIGVISVTGNGTWAYSLDGTAWQDIGTVSNSAVLLLSKDAMLRYTPKGESAETAGISYRAWDATTGTEGSKVDLTGSGATGGTTAFSVNSDSASLAVTAVNDAPVLEGHTPDLGTTYGTTAKTVTLASFINGVTGTTKITDADPSAVLGGIAVIGVTGRGTWAYSINGTTFTNLGAVSEEAALLLPKGASLRYTPAKSETAEATVTYRAWDATSGTNGSKADTTTNGENTAFSTATDTASLNITSGSISGYVYFDGNNDGLRYTSGSTLHAGIQGVALRLLTKNSAGQWTEDTTHSPVLTAADGSYHFTGLGPGTYRVQELQPVNYTDGKETRGKIGGQTKGTVGADYIDMDLAAGESGTAYNFAERGLQSKFITLAMFLSSSPPMAQYVNSVNTSPVADLKAPAAADRPKFHAGLTSVSAVSSSALLTDADSPVLAKMTAAITNRKDGRFETLSTNVSGTPITSSYSNGVLTLTGPADLIDFQTVLRRLRYGNSAESPTTGNRTIRILLNDGIDGSKSYYTTVAVVGAPTGYTIEPDHSVIGRDDAESTGFTFAGADVGTTYRYTVTSSAGGTAVTGSGRVTSATQHVAGIDVSGLNDGTLTFSVTLTDADGNTGPAATATATLSKNAPTGYSITVDDGTLGAADADSTGFTFAAAEVGATYEYTVSSSGGGDDVTGSGTITSATQHITGIDVSGLNDGTLTFSVTLTGTNGGEGPVVTDTATLDTEAPSGYTIAANDANVNATKATNTGFTFTGAEVGAAYSYSVTSTGGGTAVTGSGTVTAAGQSVTGINVSTLTDGTLTFSVTLTDAAGNAGTAVTATATLDKTAPVAPTIAANDASINASEASNTGFTFTGATVGTTYNYTVTSSGGGTAVTGTGAVTSATQSVTGINVSTLSNGTLTFSVTLTDTAGNVGTAATATATLDRVAPSGYTIAAKDAAVGPSKVTTTGFTFTGAEVGTTYNYTVTSSGGGTPITGTGTITSTTQLISPINVSALTDGTLTYSVTLTDAAGNVGAAATATAKLDRVAPAGYTIAPNSALINGASATTAGFTFTGAEVDAIYNYTVTSSGGGTPVIGTGTVTSAGQSITPINVSTLPDGTLTFKVTLTDAAGNLGAEVTTTAAMDKTAPPGYTIAANDATINAAEATSTGFKFTGAEVGATFTYTVTSSGGGTPVGGNGNVTAADQTVTGIDVSSLPNGTLTYKVKLTDAAGNVGAEVETTATLDRTAPSGYTITRNDALINATEAAATGFTFAGATVGATYNYTVTSSGGGTDVTGSGPVTAADQSITVNVSTLNDGTLTFKATLTDTAGNTGAEVTTTATLDKTAPAGYTIAPHNALINAATATTTGFTFTGAEVGTSYTYTVTSTGGGTTVTAGGVIASANQSITPIDVSGLNDGTLTFKVTLTDAAGNTGAEVTTTATLDRIAPPGYAITANEAQISAAEAASTGFTFAGAELGATYNYTVTSNGGAGQVTGTGAITAINQNVTGIDVSSLPAGTLTFKVTLTDAAGNIGAEALATATLDKTAPAGYTIVAKDADIGPSKAANTGFIFATAEIGATYHVTVTSSGGGTAVTSSGTVAAADETITSINVASLPDGTLTFSVTLTDVAGNEGAATTATAKLDRVAPIGYTVVRTDPVINAAKAVATGFTFDGAEVGTTYQVTVTSTGGGTAVTSSGAVTSATQTVANIDVSTLNDGTLTFKVTLTDAAGNTGIEVTTSATLDQTAPIGYTIEADDDTLNAAEAASTGFAFAGAELGTTYNYTVTSSGGGTPVSGSGLITSATQHVTGINVSALPDGTLAFSVTLTGANGNPGLPATDTAALDKTAPAGYTIAANDSPIGPSKEHATGFTINGAEVGATYSFTVTSSGGAGQVTGNGSVTLATQEVTGIDVSGLAEGTLTFTVRLTDAAGNAGTDATTTAVLDRTAPAPFTIAAKDALVNIAKATSTGFIFTGAEVGATYHVTVTSTGGGLPVISSGTVTAVDQTVSGINVSALTDGTLTFKVTLTDPAGNLSAEVETTTTLDQSVPAPFTIAAIDSLLNGTEAAATGFRFTGATVGATYHVTVTSTGGGTDVHSTGTVAAADETITGINVASLPDGTLTFHVTLTGTNGNTGPEVTTTATLDTVPPSGYTIAANDAAINGTEAAATAFTISNAEVGASYNYSISSGGSLVVGSGTITSATQVVTGIDISALLDGTLTFSVTLTDAANNTGDVALATSKLDRVAPAGYTIAANDALVNIAKATSTGFKFTGAEVDASYRCTVISSGGGATLVATGTVTAADETISGIDVSSLPDGTLTFSVKLTDAAGNEGLVAEATATLNQSVPPAPGISITPAHGQVISAFESTSTAFTFAGATVGTTYTYTVTSSGGAGQVTASGPVSAPGQTVSGINVSTLPDGTLTYSVTLTNTYGNTGPAATANATLDKTAPTGYTITPNDPVIGTGKAASTGFRLDGAEVGTTYQYEIQRSSGGPIIFGSGVVNSATQVVTGIDVSSLTDGTLDFRVWLTDAGPNNGVPVTAAATLDRVPPAGYAITANDQVINALKATATGFTFSGAELGTTCNYTVTSSNGGTPVSGSVAITSDTQVVGIDVSTLPNGDLTYHVTLTDAGGNAGTEVTAQATLDKTAPAGYTIVANDATIDATTALSTGFKFTGAELGTTYNYTITSSNGGTPINGTGTITAADQTLSGINVSTLRDGTLTFTVTLTDTAGNVGAPTTATASLARQPSSVGLSNSSVEDNHAAPIVVGTLSTTDPDPNDTFIYTLVSGTGSTDNAKFSIVNGNQLQLDAATDWVVQPSYTVRVRSTDSVNLWVEQVLVITVNNANPVPATLNLDNLTVPASPAGSTVGTLSISPSGTYNYALVSGAGDNAKFTIAGDTLKTAEALTPQSTYSVVAQGFSVFLASNPTSGTVPGSSTVYVMSTTYDPGALPSGFEQPLANAGELYLAAQKPDGTWDNAALGTSVRGQYAQDKYLGAGPAYTTGSWSNFWTSVVAAHPAATAQDVLGSWGVDTEHNMVWAVVDYSGLFAAQAVILAQRTFTVTATA
jgi:hypothetical protein